MDQGLSYQVLAMGFAKERAGVQGCAVVKYHWGGKPGKYSQVPNYGNNEVLAYQFCEFEWIILSNLSHAIVFLRHWSFN